MDINPIHINTIGLIFDIIGACFVSWEVVRQFHGKKIDKSPYIHDADDPPFETEEYKKWELSKYKRMKWGLVFLIFGFCLQISSNYLPLINPPKTRSRHSEIRPTKQPPQNNAEEPAISPTIKTIPLTKKRDINTK